MNRGCLREFFSRRNDCFMATRSMVGLLALIFIAIGLICGAGMLTIYIFPAILPSFHYHDEDPLFLRLLLGFGIGFSEFVILFVACLVVFGIGVGIYYTVIAIRDAYYRSRENYESIV